MLTLPKHMASYVTIEEVEYVNPSETHGIICYNRRGRIC
jgi:hypothetical protein